jgi:hypothetical protein
MSPSSGPRMINHAFEDLAQSLRVLLEADYRARAGLMRVDRAEAVGNIENALAGVLNAFHSLYDATQKEPGYNGPEWYSDGPLALLLAIRNARHHNKANKIRTLPTFHAQEAERPVRMERYVFVDFPSTEDDGDTFDVYLSWADLRDFLSLPQRESRLRPTSVKLVKTYLGAGQFAAYASQYDLPESRVFFNIVPLLLNAGLSLMPSIKEFITPTSTEARHFVWHFTEVGHADTQNPEVAAGPFALPG